MVRHSIKQTIEEIPYSEKLKKLTPLMITYKKNG
ncbi:hypothetical protein DEU42_10744 [Flavobacterium sp. AG291]|nr:hypothetical protein DEU42_10744 [Flavobacterium sp. AG291]